MKLGNKEINRYAVSIHSALIALLWTLFGLLWAYIVSQRSLYSSGIALNVFFYFPAFTLNRVFSWLLGVNITKGLLSMGGAGSGLKIGRASCRERV